MAAYVLKSRFRQPLKTEWHLEEGDVQGARCLRSPRGVIDVNVIRGDILPNDLHMACLGIPGPAGWWLFMLIIQSSHAY